MVSLALQEERRQRCSQLVSMVPLKWHSGGATHAVTLGHVQTFSMMGVLKDEELRDLEAALGLLVRLLTSLAACLDFTLPFPCSGGRGYAAVAATASKGGQGPGPRTWQWMWPCVLNRFTKRWHYFSVYDNICTAEFAVALQLLNQDLLKLCYCQGEVPPEGSSTLQLLVQLLSAVQLGCVSPRSATEPRLVQAVGDTTGPGKSSEFAPEDGEWLVLEHPGC